MRRHIGQVGDTIVEVLIAIIIVGSILVGAFVATQQNSTTEQNAQEQSQALNIAQIQIEALRANNVTSVAQTFCMIPSGSSYTPSGVGDFPPPGPPATASTDDFSLYPTDGECNFSNSGSNDNATEPIYHVFIKQNSSDQSFAVTVRWYAATGHNVENLTLYYRVN